MRPAPTPAAPTLRAVRILAAALMAAPVIVGIALFFIVGSHGTGRYGNPVVRHSPGAWVYVVIAVVGLAGAVGAQAFGYRLPALSPTLDAEEARGTALRAYQQSMIQRFAMSEAVAIVGIALTFGSHSNTVLPYVLAAAIAEALMAFHIWPSDSLISRVEQRLDRNGGRSELAEALRGSTQGA